MKNNIINLINKKKINIAVIGLGYVGLPLCMRFIKAGFNVYGIDTDKLKINSLKKGLSYINNLKINKLNFFKKNKSFLSSEYSLVKKAHIIIIALPTPLKDYQPDMKYIKNCVANLKKFKMNGKVIILESTVYPGATEEYLSNVKFRENLSYGKNFFLGYSPERENPGDKKFTYDVTPKVVSGKSNNCKKIVQKLYSKIVKKVHVTNDIKTAELSKLLENTYRAINIGFINEFKIMSDRLGLNVWDVIKAARTKNFGFISYFPGPGIGGHCIPIDPFYLDWSVKKKKYKSKFISASKKINIEVFNWTLEKIKKFFKKNLIDNSKIIFLGVSYKKNTNDLRESPSLKLFKKLYQMNFRVRYHDPYVKKITLFKQKEIKSIKNLYDHINNNIVVIATNHDYYNYELLLKKSKYILDLRGTYINWESDKIYKF